MSDQVGGFLPVFEQRLGMLKKRLKEELEKKKHDRSKHTLKHTIKEIRRWEDFIHKQKKLSKNKCPHCGETL